MAGGLAILAGLYGADQGVKIGRDYINYELQKKLQANAADINYKYSLLSAKNMPSANRAGLEFAGYNPMLAVQNSTSGANSSWTSSGSLSSQAGDSLSDSFSNVQDIQRLENETKLADTQSDLFIEQSKTEDSKRTNLQFQNAMLDVEKHLKEKDLDSYDRRFYSELYEQMQRAENYRAMANVQGYNAETARISANAQKLNAEVAEKWTPGKIGAGLAVAGLGLLGPGKFVKPLKNVTKISKRSRNGRNSIIQTFNEY